MVAVGSRSLLSGIVLSQVGCPLAHRQEGFIDCVSSDRFATLPVASASEPEDEQAGELGFLIVDSVEGWADALLLAEFGPDAKCLALGGSVFVASG